MFKVYLIRFMNGYFKSLDLGNEENKRVSLSRRCVRSSAYCASTESCPRPWSLQPHGSKSLQQRSNSEVTIRLASAAESGAGVASSAGKNCSALVPRLLLMLRERSLAAAAEVAARAGTRPPALRSPLFLHAPVSTPQRARSPTHKTMSSLLLNAHKTEYVVLATLRYCLANLYCKRV